MIKPLRSRKGSKGVHGNGYKTMDLYKDYSAMYDIDPAYKLTKTEYVSIVSDFCKALMKAIIYEGFSWIMPHRIGHFGVIKKKMRVTKNFTLAPVVVDWHAVEDTKDWVPFDNTHTNGFVMSYKWSKKTSKVANTNCYRLIMSRSNKRELAKAIKEHCCDYPENKLIIK